MSITMFLGRNGWSKTFAVVQYGVLPCWELGRRVVSNISLYPEELGYPEDLYQPLNEPLIELPRLGRHVRRICVRCKRRVRYDVCRACGEPAVELPRMHPDGGFWSITANQGVGLVLDEIVTMFPARDSVSLPPELQRLLNQWRKPDIAPVMITAPDWKRCDVMIRETVQTVVECRPWQERLQFFLRVAEKPPVPWGWPRYGWFEHSFYAGEAYELATTNAQYAAQLRPSKVRRSISGRRRARIQASYDTDESVELADHISCATCGGKYQRGRCQDPDGHRAAARDARRQVLAEYITPKALQAAGLHAEAEQLDEELLALREAAVSSAAGPARARRTKRAKAAASQWPAA